MTVAETTIPVHVLDQRLTAASRVLLEDPIATSGEAGAAAAVLLPALTQRCIDSRDMADLWLLLTALGGALPSEEELRAASRCLELATGVDAEFELLDIASGIVSRTSTSLEMTVVSDTHVVDVDFCARHDIHTGIQRVVRETVPRWNADHDLLAVAWTDDYTALRTLRRHERTNVFAYSDTKVSAGLPEGAESDAAVMVVPWGCVVAIPEVPDPRSSPYLATLAQFSPNRLVAIGYDMIPIVSAEQRPMPDASRFTQYLNVIKHADRVAAISRSSAAEFSGFADALSAQGLTGPVVTEVPLSAAPLQVSHATSTPSLTNDRPQVLCIGTHEPHKNHATLMHAAERLWREGLDFELVFAGGAGWRSGESGMCFDRALEDGRPVRNLGRASDSAVSDALKAASFSVFISLHEGFGLPLAESLASGTPAITSSFGSLLEIAEDGGCLTVDPRSDDEVTAAMRRLLTDPNELSRLKDEVSMRPARTWDTYANELWETLMSQGPA